MSSIRSRMRSRATLYVVLALAASTLAGVGLDQATSAQALSGRRLCMYIDGWKHDGLWTFVAANSTKYGKCPYVNKDVHPELVAGNPDDIPKHTCEEVSSWVGYEDDICRVLEKDMLYELVLDTRTGEPAKRTPLGHVSDFD